MRKIIESRRYLLQAPNLHGGLPLRFAAVASQSKFSIKKMYIAMLPQHPKVPWKCLTLQAGIHPRYKFILWLTMKRRLATVDRLLKFGIIVPPTFVFYNTYDETLLHLFFNCTTTKALWHMMLVWLGVHRAIGSWQEEVQWTTTMAKRKSDRGAITSVVSAMVIALVWRDRNLIRFQSHNYNEDILCKEIVVHLHIRGRTRRKWQPVLSQLNPMP
ncbi:uncharacterized protein LOC132613033 [Lycium barbarum]|uniref:uncharacterized protein LOC132613033 n=1 Tax=Lycium barbarum TaxID=112863 RepID=UPI00293E6D03|nr:uncharacterized protein LOC132613033 [Lycium barbarum]